MNDREAKGESHTGEKGWATTVRGWALRRVKQRREGGQRKQRGEGKVPLGDWAAALNGRELLLAPWLGTKPGACSAEQDQLGPPPGSKAGREEAGGDAGKAGSVGKQRHILLLQEAPLGLAC